MTQWTKTPPTESGWYWRRVTNSDGERSRPVPFRIDEYGGPLESKRIEYWPIPLTPPTESPQ